MTGRSEPSLLTGIRHRAWTRGLLFIILVALVYIIAVWPLLPAIGVVLGSVVLLVLFLRPEYGVALLAFAVPFGSLRQVQFGSVSVGATDLFVALVVVSWAIRMLAAGRVELGKPALAAPIVLFVVACLLSLLGARPLSLSLAELVKWLELLAVYLFTVRNVGPRPARFIVAAVLAAGTMQGVLGIYQFLRQIGPPQFVLYGRFMRASGTFQQPNPFGGYIGLTLPLALGLAMVGWGKWAEPQEGRRWMQLGVRALVLGAVAVMGAALLTSWSRGAWLGFAAAVVTVGFAKGWRWVGIALLAALIIFGLMVVAEVLHLVPGSLLGRVTDLDVYLQGLDVGSVEITDENWAVVERLAHWNAAQKMMDDHPWTGVGLGNYAFVYPDYALPRWQDPLGHAHNYYLNIGAEAGLVGLMAYLIMLGAWLRRAWKGVLATRGWGQGVALGALGVLVHLSVHSIFDNLYVHGMYVQVGIVLGLLDIAIVQAATRRDEVMIAG